MYICITVYISIIYSNNCFCRDVNKINDGIGDKVGHLVQNATSSIGGLVIGLVKGWQLALVIMATYPLVAVSTAICSKVKPSILFG